MRPLETQRVALDVRILPRARRTLPLVLLAIFEFVCAVFSLRMLLRSVPDATETQTVKKHFVCVWLCMVVYGCVWLCMVVCSSIKLPYLCFIGLSTQSRHPIN